MSIRERVERALVGPARPDGIRAAPEEQVAALEARPAGGHGQG